MRKKTETKKDHYDIGLREYLIAVYKNMSFALLVTSIISMAVASSQKLIDLLYGTSLIWVVLFAPIVMAIYIGRKLIFMSSSEAQTCLVIFAFLIGFSLSPIFLIYTGESIARVFFIAASTFGAMSIYGQRTEKDLSSVGSFLIMGLLGLIIIGIINIFLQSNTLQVITSIAGLGVFTLLTAYDSQKLKALYYQGENHKLSSSLAVYGSLTLYMDFINIFINLLRLIGVKRDEK